jgi:hypothetical protein
MSAAKVQRKSTEAYQQRLDEVLATELATAAQRSQSLKLKLWLRELSKMVTRLMVNHQL